MFISQNIKNLFLSTSLLLTYGISSVVATDSDEDTPVAKASNQQVASHTGKKRTYPEISKSHTFTDGELFDMWLAGQSAPLGIGNGDEEGQGDSTKRARTKIPPLTGKKRTYLGISTRHNEEEGQEGPEEQEEQGGSTKRAHTQTATHPNEYEYILPDFKETCDPLQSEFTFESVSIKDDIINEIKKEKKEYIENINLKNKISIDLLRKDDIQNLCALVLHSQGLFGNGSVIESDISLTFILHDKQEDILLKNGYLCFKGENGASILSTLLTLRDSAAYREEGESILNRFQINNIKRDAFTLLESGFKKTDKIIGLSFNEFIHFPKSEASEIDFRGNYIFCIKGDVFHEYKGLKVLDLSWNLLTHGPDLSNIPNLRVLNLSHNQLTQGPDLSNIPNLKVLDLSWNLLTHGPDLSNIPNLRVLNLSHNQLTQGLNVSNNPNLRVLNLSKNRLFHAPDLSTPDLRELDLSENQLIHPPNVSSNPNLRVLNLSHNQLTQVPDVSNNPKLSSLNLFKNRLTQGPDLSNNPNLRIIQ